LVLTALFVGSCLSAPISQLFEPFGDFLQGNVLNTGDAFYASEEFANYYKLFALTLEDSEQLDKHFNEFKGKFGKTYSSESEALKRKEIFKNNLLKVFAHNSDAAVGKTSFTQHINQFADMTVEEIINGVTGYFPSQTYEQTKNVSQQTKVGGDYYANSWIYDWRSTHIVSPVQNQGGCGACVYFAAAAVVEAHWAHIGHGVTVLSPQQLNDCAHDPRGNRGCQEGGGTFVPTFEYIQKHGLTSMQNYPYLTRDANCDHGKEAQAVAHIGSWGPVTPHGDEEALRKAAEKAPVAVAIHVSDGWARYRQGIFDEACQGGRNHAVLVVGYGYDGGLNKDYWIVKNQWGTGFGEQGFIRMRRNAGNMCDIAGDAVWVA